MNEFSVRKKNFMWSTPRDAHTAPSQNRKKERPPKSSCSIVRPVKKAKPLDFRTQHTPFPSPTRRPKTVVSANRQVVVAAETYKVPFSEDQRYVINEDLFDQLMESSLHKPIHKAFEPIVKQMFLAEKCIIWLDNPDEGCLFTPTYNSFAGYNNSLPGFIFKTRSVIQVRDPSQSPNGFKSDNNLVPPHSPQLFFALSERNISRAVVQVIQKPNAPGFSQLDMDTAQFLINKFETYGNAIFTSQSISTIALQLYSSSNKTFNPIVLLCRHFGCQAAEIWQFDTLRGSGQQVCQENQRIEMIDMNQCGIVGDAVANHRIVNTVNPEEELCYQEEFDAEIKGPILIVCAAFGRRDSWAVVLRGRDTQFSASDEAQLKALLPFIVGTMIGFNNTDDKSIFMSQLKELLASAVLLTSSLAPKNIVTTIKEETTKILECERCLLFFFDKLSNQFIAHYTMTHKRVPTNKGIVGLIGSKEETIFIENPMSDNRFDKTIDTDQGYMPTSLLGGPIYNCSHELIAVIILLTKTGDSTFTDSDSRVLTAINVFSGIAFDNIRNYQRTIKLSQKMREFVELLHRSNKESDLKPLLEQILQSAQKIIQSRRISFFVNTEQELSLFLNAGNDNKYGSIFSQRIMKSRQGQVYCPEEIAEMTKDFQEDEPESAEPMQLSNLSQKYHYSRISGIFSIGASQAQIEEENKDETRIYCVPLLNSESSLLGVLEVEVSDPLSPDDLTLLDSFAAISSMSLERIHLKDLSVLGYGEMELRDWIFDEERGKTSIPSRLILNDDILRVTFDVKRYEGIGLFKVIFKLYDHFGLLEGYKITAEQLFLYLVELRNLYKKVPYHNWRHAVDTCQFLAYQIYIARLDKSNLGQFEIFAALTAALCHDAGHAGFLEPNECTIQIPLGILYKDQSVLEMQHCSKAIEVLAKDESNIFHDLNEKDFKSLWSLIIGLILATDMAKHNPPIKKMEELLQFDEYNPMSNAEHRFLMLQLLLKTSDMCVVARPITDIVNWPFEVAEEFYKQGDLTDVAELVFDKNINDREHLKWEESRMGFYKNICLPLFRVVAAAIPLLKNHVEQIKDNIQKWARATNRIVPYFDPEPKAGVPNPSI